MIEEEKYFGYTYDELFEKSMKKMCKSIEDHQFRHFNNSLGTMIYSKKHYIHEMKKHRMLPYDICENIAEKWESRREKNYKPYDELSPQADGIIRSLKLCADKNGNIKLGGRAVNALRKIGAITGRVGNFGLEGGFK